MQITVDSVQVNKVPGKAWQQIEVSYKNDKGELKGKKVMSFSVKEGLEVLKAAQSGDVLQVRNEQDKNGYWNWVSVSKGGAAAPASGKGYSVPSRDFETKDERAARQVLIVRQSCLSTATALLTCGAKTAPKVSDVIAVAEELEMFVFGKAEAAPQGADEAEVE